MSNKLITLGCCLLLFNGALKGKAAESRNDIADSGWYAGIRGGMPLGFCTFNSFGNGKMYPVWSAGIYGGYRFNHIFSAEFSAATGHVNMSPGEGCSQYWLGADGNRYNVPVPGMEGWEYGDLYSGVTLQQYGIHLNMDLTGIFAVTRGRRWSVSISPVLYAAGTKTGLKTAGGEKTVREGDNKWHLGAGGDVIAEYRITHNLSAGIYTGITCFTGSRIDYMPEYLHKNNFIWESGVRVGWHFGKRKNTVEAVSYTPAVENIRKAVTEEEISFDDTVKDIPLAADSTETEPEICATEQQYDIENGMECVSGEQKNMMLHTIYFSFNRWAIAESQKTALGELLKDMKADTGIKVVITGYADWRGSNRVNRRISGLRAGAVKKWLMEHGITDDRIITKAHGVDRNAASAANARRAEIKKLEAE